MSDGMSDSRADTKHEKWEEVDGTKLKKPVDVFFHVFRDGVVAECILFDIEFSVSRWGSVSVPGGLADGGDAVAFVGQSAEEIARKALKEFLKKRLKTKEYEKYLSTRSSP